MRGQGEKQNAMTDRIKQFKGVLVWVMVAGIILVALTIVAVNLLDRLVIEQVAASLTGCLRYYDE